MDQLSELPIRPTKERLQHDEISIPHDKDSGATIVTQTLIDRYESRGQLCPGDDQESKSRNAALANAGRRFFVDAFHAGTVPRPGSIRAERVDGSCEAFSERYVAAVQRRRHALRMLGVDLASIADWVCVLDLSAASWALRQGYFARQGIVHLRLALKKLASHYGLLN